MTGYGDRDPEDAYDAHDPVPRRLDVLDAIADALAGTDDRRQARQADALRVAAALVGVRGVDRSRLARIRRRLERL